MYIFIYNVIYTTQTEHSITDISVLCFHAFVTLIFAISVISHLPQGGHLGQCGMDIALRY